MLEVANIINIVFRLCTCYSAFGSGYNCVFVICYKDSNSLSNLTNNSLNVRCMFCILLNCVFGIDFILTHLSTCIYFQFYNS